MRFNKGSMLVAVVTLALLSGMVLGYAQEDPDLQAAPVETNDATNNTEAGKDNSGLPDVQWLWGEIVSVDSANQQLQVKYFDYEADNEKEIAVATNNNTTYENVKAIDEIKPLDTVSIDYTVELDGKNLAKNISVEKPENNEQALPSESTDMPLEPAPPLKQ